MCIRCSQNTPGVFFSALHGLRSKTIHLLLNVRIVFVFFFFLAYVG
jgi:hypothetical protein